MVKQLDAYRDRVLDNADIKPGERILDIGCGDGMIGFGALERTGPEGHVIFADISSELLARCRARAERLGVLERCQFHLMPADALRLIGDAAVDLVTTRSVLIYVGRKDRAGRILSRVTPWRAHVHRGTDQPLHDP